MTEAIDQRVENENQKFRKIGENTMVNVAMIMNVPLMEERVENSGYLVIFQAWAAVGSSESEAVWLISKLNYDGNNFTERVWANAEDTFTKVWDDRATYNYTY